jgi:ribonuclease P protein component
MGVIVPKHGRRVVDRNLLKRRVREVGRREVLPHLEAAGAHVDVLIRMRRTAYELDFDLLRREVLDVLETLWSQGS